MDNEKSFYDGVSVLEILLKKFLISFDISDEDAKKYFIMYPNDKDRAFDYDREVLPKTVARFPIFFSEDGESAKQSGTLIVLLEDNARIIRYDAVSEEEKNSGSIIEKKVSELDFNANYDGVVSFAEVFYMASNVRRYPSGTSEYERAYKLYTNAVEEYMNKLKGSDTNTEEIPVEIVFEEPKKEEAITIDVNDLPSDFKPIVKTPPVEPVQNNNPVPPQEPVKVEDTTIVIDPIAPVEPTTKEPIVEPTQNNNQVPPQEPVKVEDTTIVIDPITPVEPTTKEPIVEPTQNNNSVLPQEPVKVEDTTIVIDSIAPVEPITKEPIVEPTQNNNPVLPQEPVKVEDTTIVIDPITPVEPTTKEPIVEPTQNSNPVPPIEPIINVEENTANSEFTIKTEKQKSEPIDFDKFVERIEKGNSEKKAYEFTWQEDILLNYADDLSLEVACSIIENGNLALEIEEKSIIIKSNLYGFCDRNETNEEYLQKRKEDSKYRVANKESSWKTGVGKPIATPACYKCKYQSCPKRLAAYILYLKNNNLLKDKWLARENFRNENKVNNGFFFFNWENKNGLKNIDDKTFEFANKLVEKDFVRVNRKLSKDGYVSIEEIFSCRDIQVSNLDINELTLSRTWENPGSLNRKLDCECDVLCASYTCRMPFCAIVVAAYIYYLKKSGQENKIKEDREFYATHKDEIDNNRKAEIKQKLDDINKKKEEKLQDLKESYEGKIENLNLTLNSILESSKTNFHCIVAGEDENAKNGFIDKIIELIKNQNQITNVRKLPASHFAKLYYHLAVLRINKDERMIYDDNDFEGRDKTYKFDENEVPYAGGYKVNKKNLLEENAIYVLDSINEFVSDYHYYEKTYPDKKMIQHAIDVLANMNAKGYVIINAKPEEIESFLNLDARLKFVYQNNVINIPTFSLEDMYESYKTTLTPDLIAKLRENEEEYKKQFNEYVSLNQKFIPFSKPEIVNYLATYANSRNELIFPPNIYKKESLDNIIGLDSVKEKVKEFEKYMLFQLQAKANGLKVSSSNMHMIFTGNPGTGKTTVARIMAKMLFDLGVVKENKLIEVERKDLVATYIGQTAAKTSEVIEKAMGGVLFIDEAYTLASESKNDFGSEAVATLIKAMEDHKDKLVVIFAGYQKEMKDFLDINPGIASRIGYTFDFPDYTIEELIEIFNVKIKNNGFESDDSVYVPLKRIFTYYSKRKSFGNGRFVDKVIQETLMNHALGDPEDLKMITEKDIPSIEQLNQNESKSGKNETAEEMLEKIIGMENVKREIITFGKYAKFVKKAELKKLNIPSTNMHMIFTGNPGTGKTTIARIIAKMLFDMEVIHENKLIEVEKKDLIGDRPSEITKKTSDIIDLAMGGVLFIDEAYTLANDWAGAEVIATLIKAMEDHKESLIVIFAGYRDEMKSFLDVNPGIASRIGYTFNFEDYNVKELMEMFYMKMKKSGFEFEDDIEVPLKRVCDYFIKRKNFGNGRFVDKVIQKTLMKHAIADSENIELITESDIPTIEELTESGIKINTNVEEALAKIVGMESLKKEIVSLGTYVSFIKEAEKQNLTLPDSNMHMLFTGNPGTGKTTVARIIAKLLFDMGVIHENKLVEAERKDLVAEWIGQTAPKTTEVIERAMGGVLFIDEAYTLAPSDSFRDFGAEAIATLIKAMEDHKGELVVIFAGYQKEMKHFLDSNPGIASRIGYTFNFEDYSDSELTEIYRRKVVASGMTLSDDAMVKVKEVMKYFYKVENIGNGRFADKVFAKTMVNHSKNYAEKAKNANGENVISAIDITTITAEDIPSVQEITKTMLDGASMIDPSRITQEDLRKTAIHEVGHATVGYLLLKKIGIKKITCTAEGGGSLGYVEYDNSNASYVQSKEELLNQIKRLLAGIASEEVFLGIYKNGGTSDIEKATRIARNMITRYGMSDLGLAHISSNNSALEKTIYDESNKILGKCFEEVKVLITENKAKMSRVVEYLLEKGEINEEEFVNLLNNGSVGTINIEEINVSENDNV
ncbi:MAG: AAA family ATPase [Clostridia bacterium]|nr:AAA family ATPase [Clostridia bacterium]